MKPMFNTGDFRGTPRIQSPWHNEKSLVGSPDPGRISHEKGNIHPGSIPKNYGQHDISHWKPSFLNFHRLLPMVADIPAHDSSFLATFADNTCILFSYVNPIRTSYNLQEHLRNIENWFRRWRAKVKVMQRAPTSPIHSFTSPPVPSPLLQFQILLLNIFAIWDSILKSN